MKYVWVQYYPGDAGTFFAWFINQHQGFVRNRVPFKINDPVINEVICDPMMWEWNEMPFKTGFLRGTLLNEANAPFDLENTRVSFKTYPQHNLHEIDWDSDDPNDSKQMLKDRIKRMQEIEDLSTVQLVVENIHKEHFVKRMQAAFDTFKEGDTAESMYRHRDDDYVNTWDLSQEHLPDARHQQIDIGKLLIDNCDKEYDKLCNFLGMIQNPHWKTIMNFYRWQVFENY